MEKNIRYLRRLVSADYKIDEVLKEKFTDSIEYYIAKQAVDYARDIKLKSIARDYSRQLIKKTQRADLITDEDVEVEDQKILVKHALDFIKENFNLEDEKSLDIIRKWASMVEKIFGSAEKFKKEFGFSLLDKADYMIRNVQPSVWDHHINNSLYANRETRHKVGCLHDWALISSHEELGATYKCACGAIKEVKY